MTDILLDRIGDAPTPAHYTVITTEVEFLQHAPNPRAPLFVRGKVLCDWAEAFFTGRQRSVEEALSPSAELRALCPALTDSQCQAIYRQLQSIYATLERPLSINRLMDALFPAQLWQQLPSQLHAANYLLWLSEAQIKEWVQPLLAAQCEHWQKEFTDVTQIAYSAHDASSAQALLDSWLGVPGSKPLADLGAFPLDIPAQLQDRVRKAWWRSIIESHGDCLVQLDDLPVPPSIKQIVAKEAVAYYRDHPDELNEPRVRLLCKYLSSKEQSELFARLAPKAPSALSDKADANTVLTWFHEEYLPYRLWQSTYGNTESAREIVEKAARQFALWYLTEYPTALMGGALRQRLSFVQTAKLSTDVQSAMTLLIVLDGLHAADAQYLRLAVQRHTTRLTALVDGLTYAPLPTITEFCKDALLKGLPPAQTKQVDPIGAILPENESPVQQLSAARKDALYIWRVLEPDRTYHWRNNHDMLKREVEAQLEAIANKIADIVEQVPANRPLQIVITTDHGRLLARSERTLDVPSGMQAHGRTAWGDVSRAYPASGYIIDGEIVFLHGERFGLQDNTAIILSEAAFRTADGKAGSELFPHGGLYPEEVIIPWLVYVRDATQPQVKIEVHGRGQAGKHGEIAVRVINLDKAPVTLGRLTIQSPQTTYTVSLDWLVDPSSDKTQTYPIESWPTAAVARMLRASVSLRSENGLTFEIDAQTALQSEEMYQRNNILEGLD